MRLSDLTAEQFGFYMDYLQHTASTDLWMEIQFTLGITPENPTKVRETLQNIQRWSGECAKYLEDHPEALQQLSEIQLDG